LGSGLGCGSASPGSGSDEGGVRALREGNGGDEGSEDGRGMHFDGLCLMIYELMMNVKVCCVVCVVMLFDGSCDCLFVLLMMR
jgi:hypothetical protein